MIAIIGKTATGKTSIVEELINYGYEKIITYTTRPIRDNEINGIDYHFISEEEFLEKKANGFFIETTHYDMIDRRVYYGTSKADIYEDNDNKAIILNPEGFTKFKTMGIPMISFYLKCNESTISSRLIQRGDNDDEAKRRIEADNADFIRFDIAEATDYVLRNDVGFSPKQMAYLIKEIYDNISTYNFFKERV